MELPSNTIKLEAKDFTLDMHAKVYKDDPIINNVLLTVRVVSYDFSGAMQMDVGSLDLDEFVRKLTMMYKTLKGEARIEEPYGNKCFINFKIDRTGHVKVNGKLNVSPQQLLFENEFDQTYLEKFVKHLAETDEWQEIVE